MENDEIINDRITLDSYECTVTVDCAVFGFQEGVLKILLIQRTMDKSTGLWFVPGGLMKQGQEAEQAVDEVLFNLTGLKDVHQEQVHTYTTLDRHPVKRVITICYYGLVKPENHPIIKMKHVDGVEWFRLDELPQLAFDHGLLVRDALEKLMSNVEERLILGELLPKKFTLTELQELYEAMTNQKLDRRNFRKKILQKDLIKKSGEKKIGVKGGPDLFEFK